MGLEEAQRGLAALLTSDTLRERFATDPQGVALKLRLEPEDAALLSALAPAELERFARSLRAKRWNEAQKLLPLSVRAAQGVEFPLRRLFLQFAQTYAPRGSMRHVRDAIEFAAWLARRPSETFVSSINNSPDNSDEGSPPSIAVAWLPDLLRYEAAWLEMNMMPTRLALARRFVYPVTTLARAVLYSDREGLDMARFPVPRPLVIVWLRPFPHGPLRRGCLTARPPASGLRLSTQKPRT